jgi:HlyD family secretion protein
MATATKTRKRRWFGRPLIIVAVIAVLGLIGFLGFQSLNAQTAVAPGLPEGWSTAAAQTGVIDATVSATGSVEPNARAELRFAIEGTVTEVLVKAGDQVKAGQPLARLATTDLQLALERAQAELKQANADYEQVVEKATPAEIAEAQARLDQAQAQYREAAGKVSQADINAARAKLEAARAQLNTLLSGNTDLTNAQNDLAKAEAKLQSTRDRLSLEKTNAEFALTKAVNDLTRVQSRYATVKGEWLHVQETSRDPYTGFRVNDAQRQGYYDAFVQAEAELQNAESEVQNAKVKADQARQTEITGIAEAELEVQTAKNKIRQLEAGGNQNQIATARAAVAEAEAQLTKLTGANRAAELANAQAGIDTARAGLDKLNNDPKASALTRAEAGRERAELAVRQAESELSKATMLAPFDGTIARVDLRVGERAGQTVIAMADLRTLYVNVPVDELDVGQVKEGQLVQISVDALLDRELTGRVTNIDPLATRNTQGTNTYTVKITIESGDPTVRPGMTATAQIVTLRKENAVLVPRRAVRTENGQNYVLIPKEGPADPRLPTPPSDRREVTIGLSNNEQVEILSGLQVGEEVLLQDVVSTFNPVQ